MPSEVRMSNDKFGWLMTFSNPSVKLHWVLSAKPELPLFIPMRTGVPLVVSVCTYPLSPQGFNVSQQAASHTDPTVSYIHVPWAVMGGNSSVLITVSRSHTLDFNLHATLKPPLWGPYDFGSHKFLYLEIFASLLLNYWNATYWLFENTFMLLHIRGGRVYLVGH